MSLEMRIRWLATVLALTALLAGASADDLTGKKKKDPPKPPPKTSPPPKKSDPPPKKENPPPKKENPPPKKSDPPPRKEEPRRSDPPPRREEPRGTGGIDQRRGQEPVRRTPTQPDDILRRSRPRMESRSGKVSYGTTHNNRVDTRNIERIERAPTSEELRTHTLNREIRREDNVRVRQEDRTRSRVRVGYHHWDPNWRDDNYCYPHYSFDPYQHRSMISPWYYYPYLPGYVSYTRVYTVSPLSQLIFGDQYNWRRSNRSWDNDGYDRDRRNDLDYAIEDIQDAYLDNDVRAVSRLVPRGGMVTLNVDGATVYGVSSDDFYDMLVDSIESSRTLDYEIVDVITMNDEADVIARHVFRDSWGERVSVYHKYRLVYERGKAVIRGFGSSRGRYF